MTAAFDLPLTLDEYRAAALVAQAAYRGNPALAYEATAAIGGPVLQSGVIPATSILPMGVWTASSRLIIVAFSGTANLTQWVLNVLGSRQVTISGIPGAVAQYWGEAGLQVRAALQDLEQLLPDARLVVIGHSLGGAIGQVLLSMWGPLAGLGAIAITYGCPRVGDSTFAAALAGQVFRVEDTDDPVVTVPPSTWAGQGSPWVWPFGIAPAVYQHAGEAITLNEAGDVIEGEEHISFWDACQQVQAFSAPTHWMDEYLRRLDLAARWEGFGGDYAAPAQLDLIDAFLMPEKGNPLLGGGPVATCQGIMFFRTSEESQGWSEAWYADLAVPNMLETLKGLLSARASFLAGTCEIHAYRASIVQPGVARSSRTTRLRQPMRATISIKDSNASGQTNDTMDAIDYLCTSTANASRKTSSFRGIPDEWISGSRLTNLGLDGVGRIETFLAAVKAANLGLRVYSRGGDFPVKPCVSMAQDAASKLIKVTVTAHGLPDGSVVTLRSVKANPMLAGRWKIGVVDPNTFLLAGSSKFNVNSANDGTVQLYGNGVDGIATYDFSGVSTRKTGRPFGSRRGRRSAKLLHH